MAQPTSTPWQNNWLQACTQAMAQWNEAPFKAQAAYWQTVQTIMHYRSQTLQQIAANTQACATQSFTQTGNWPQQVSSWVECAGQNAALCATLNADTHAARTHLWQQWKSLYSASSCTPTSFQQAQQAWGSAFTPTAGISTPAQQTASTYAAPQPKAQTQTVAPSAAPQPATTTPKRQPTVQTGSYNPISFPTLPYTYQTSHIRGTFISAQQPQQQATVAELPLENPTQLPETSNVESLTHARTRMTGSHVTPASGARRSVVARRTSGRRASR